MHFTPVAMVTSIHANNKMLSLEKKKLLYLGDSSHQPHSLLWVCQEHLGHNRHENSEDFVARVANPGDELREGSEELVRC